MKPLALANEQGAVARIVARCVGGYVVEELARADVLGYVYADFVDTGGVWRTIRGRRIFIREGEDLDSALKRSLRGGNKNKVAGNQDKITNFLAQEGIARNKINFVDKISEGDSPYPGHTLATYDRFKGFLFNRKFVDTGSADEVMGVVKHELSHAKVATAAPIVRGYINNNFPALERDGATTSYSKMVWQSQRPLFKVAGVVRDQAMFHAVDESLAEMARLGVYKGSYQKLQQLVESKWKIAVKDVAVRRAQRYSQISSGIDYAQIARDLDELEDRTRRALLPLLINARNVLIATARRREGELYRAVPDLKLAGLPQMRRVLRALLRRAWLQGGEDARSEVGAVRAHAAWDESRHPRNPKGDEKGGEFAPVGGGSSAKVSVDSSGHGLVKDNVYAGVTDNEWQDWTQYSDDINLAIEGKLKAGSYSSQGEKLTEKDIAEFKNIGERIQAAAAANYVTGNFAVFRGESYGTLDEALALYKRNAVITTSRLTGTTNDISIATEYASGAGSNKGSAKVLLAFQQVGGIQGIQTAPLGVPSNEIIFPKGAQFRVSGVRRAGKNSLVVELYNKNRPSGQKVADQFPKSETYGGLPGLIAHAGNQSDFRQNYNTYASPSFTPRGAVQWMNAKELFITGLLGDKIVAQAKGIIVNAVKTGEAGSVTVEKLWKTFEPFIGDPDVLRDGEPLAPYQLETIIRTNTTEAYNHGRLNEFVREDLLPFLDGVRYSAVMDSRTTPVCAFLDGKVFDPESPDLAALLPPNHFNCRSIIVPIVAGEQIDAADFITPDEVGQAKALADVKFLVISEDKA